MTNRSVFRYARAPHPAIAAVRVRDPAIEGDIQNILPADTRRTPETEEQK